MDFLKQKSLYCCISILFFLLTPSIISGSPEIARHYTDITVLGYVTPWNARGRDLLEVHRAKFDIVCPVWYTVHADENHHSIYNVRGGPTGNEDVEWYKRLQKTSEGGAKSLQITPRFILDGWSQSDYRALVFNETRWSLLSQSIMNVVEKMDYDGIVFESGFTHALVPPLSILSESLHGQHKILAIVSPPIRKSISSDVETHNDMVIRSIAQLADLADYISIMTYDMTGPAGQECTRDFPGGSLIQMAQKKGNVREPGPNTNAHWVRENLAACLMTSDAAVRAPDGVNEQQLETMSRSTTFLAGLPLYGYKYPILHVDEQTGQFSQPQASNGVVAILKGAGESITLVEIQQLLDEHEPEILKTEDGEFFFDYSKNSELWRLFMPTEESMQAVLAAVFNVFQDKRYGPGKVGIALWEVGQATQELLSIL